MTLLPNVKQAYSLLIQEEMQYQVTSEFTENFSIIATVQKKTTYSKFTKDKSCEHCNRLVIQLMSVEPLSFTINFVIKGKIQKVDVDRKIIMER